MEETRGEEMKNLFNSVAWFKVYFNGLASYLGIINFLLLLLTFKSVYDINIKAIFIIPLAVLFGGLIGYIDYKFIQKPQNLIANQVNDLKQDLEEIRTGLRNNNAILEVIVYKLDMKELEEKKHGSNN